jgi:hypothetical protein
MELRHAPHLAYWYRLETGPRASWLLTDARWSVADGDGRPLGVVEHRTTGILQTVAYQLSDTAGAAVLGLAEPPGARDAMKDPAPRLHDAVGAEVGAIRDTSVEWGGRQVAKFTVRTTDDPHRFDGAWMWDMGDRIVATVTQTRAEGVGASFGLDRPEDLDDVLATVTLAAPLAVHHVLLRATQVDIRRRTRHREMYGHGGGEQTDLL